MGQKRGEVRAEPWKEDYGLQAHLSHPPGDLPLEGPFAEEDEPCVGVHIQNGRDRFKENLMPLPWNELGGHPHHAVILPQAEVPPEHVRFGWVLEGPWIQGAVDASDLLGRDTLLQQDAPNLLGDGDYGIEQSVLGSQGPPGFRVVHSPGEDGGESCHLGGEGAQSVGAPAGVEVDQVRSFLSEEPAKAEREGQIGVSRHGQGPHGEPPAPGLFFQVRSLGDDQHAIDSPKGQSLYQE